MKCKNCQCDLLEGALFCDQCGTQVGTSLAEPAKDAAEGAASGTKKGVVMNSGRLAAKKPLMPKKKVSAKQPAVDASRQQLQGDGKDVRFVVAKGPRKASAEQFGRYITIYGGELYPRPIKAEVYPCHHLRVTIDVLSRRTEKRECENEIGNQDPQQIEAVDIWDRPQNTQIADCEFPIEETGCSVVCETCDGKGKVVCKECGGKVRTCATCHGEGHHTCSDCHGSKEVRCSWCHGSGKEKCKVCHGDGWVTEEFDEICPNCRGSGWIDEHDIMYGECKVCRRTGHVTTRSRRVCPNCNGTERQPCFLCDGKGVLSCDRCDKNGQEPCRDCGSTGKVQCKTCHGAGVEECGDCKGHGRHNWIYYCIQKAKVEEASDLIFGSGCDEGMPDDWKERMGKLPEDNDAYVWSQTLTGGDCSAEMLNVESSEIKDSLLKLREKLAGSVEAGARIVRQKFEIRTCMLVHYVFGFSDEFGLEQGEVWRKESTCGRSCGVWKNETSIAYYRKKKKKEDLIRLPGRVLSAIWDGICASLVWTGKSLFLVLICLPGRGLIAAWDGLGIFLSWMGGIFKEYGVVLLIIIAFLGIPLGLACLGVVFEHTDDGLDNPWNWFPLVTMMICFGDIVGVHARSDEMEQPGIVIVVDIVSICMSALVLVSGVYGGFWTPEWCGFWYRVFFLILSVFGGFVGIPICVGAWILWRLISLTAIFYAVACYLSRNGIIFS